MHLRAGQCRVGSREVDVLEDAERAPALRQRLHRAEPVGVDHHELARANVAHRVCADEVERAALGGHDPVVADAAERERPDAVSIPAGDERVLGERDEREGTVELRHRRRDGLGERARVAGDERGDHFRV